MKNIKRVLEGFMDKRFRGPVQKMVHIEYDYDELTKHLKYMYDDNPLLFNDYTCEKVSVDVIYNNENNSDDPMDNVNWD